MGDFVKLPGIAKKGHFAFGLLLGLTFLIVSVALDQLALPFAEAKGAPLAIVGLVALFDRFFLAWAIWVVYVHCHVLQGEASKPDFESRALFPGVARFGNGS